MPDALILGATFALAAAPYLAWPSRWNIMTHLAVAFWLVAFFVPVAIVGVTKSQPPQVVERFGWVLACGAISYVVGVVFGSALSPKADRGIFARLRNWSFHDRDLIARRTLFVGLVAILALGLALARMGFVPILADDPFAAKFLRGAYGEAYKPVAPLYRAASGILTVLLPILLIYGLTATRSWRWRLSFVFGFLLMLGTLQREPAVTGVLLVLGVWLIGKRHSILFFLAAVGTYTAGAMYYLVLGRLGIFEAPDVSSQSFSETIALSAPDATDALWFLARWSSYGEPLTYGRTFLGGIVPGNYEWNPSVWSLTLGNPSVDIESITSGGLRLPLPVWGLTAFGEIGMIAVPFVSGVLAGALAKMLSRTFPHLTSTVARLWAVVLFSAYWAVFVEFVTIGYLTVVQFAVVYWACRGFRQPALDAAPPTPFNRSGARTRQQSRSGAKSRS